MRNWFDYDTQKWVSEKPERYFVNLTCIKTGEKIFVGDTISIVSHNKTRTNIVVHDRYPFIVTYNDFDQKLYRPILISH